MPTCSLLGTVRHLLLLGVLLASWLSTPSALWASVTLSWNYAVEEEGDIVGFAVWRAAACTGVYTRLTSTPLAATTRTYVDSAWDAADPACWLMTAVNAEGRESWPSNPAVLATTFATDTSSALLLHWPLDDQTTPTADSSGTGADGTVSATGATWTTDSPASGAAALLLDGSSGSVTTTQNLGTPVAVTLSLWVMLSSLSTPADILSLGDHVVLRLTPTALEGSYYTGGGTWETVTMPMMLSDNWVHLAYVNWVHLAYVVTAGEQVLYVNGARVAGDTAASPLVLTGLGSGVTVGHHGNGGASWFAGRVDDVRVYGRALTLADIVALADTLPPSCTISAPTTIGMYQTASTPLPSLGGSATDMAGSPAWLTWLCPTCAPSTGLAENVTNWTITDLGLTDDTANLITLTVHDFAENTGTCQLTVQYDSTPDLTQLVAYWPLDEASGNFSDATGSGHTAIPSGSITRVAGQVGPGAVQFDGATGSLNVQGLLGFSASTPDITLSAWVRRTATGQSDADVVSLGNYVALRLSGTTATGFFYTGASWSVLPAAIPDDTAWHHLAYTAQAGTQVLYIDGAVASAGSETAALAYTGQGSGLVIGHHGNGGAFWFAGTVDEVRVHNRILSGTDIATLMAAGSMGSEELLHLSMNEGSPATTTADTSPNAVTGTLGTATWSPGRLGGAGLACASGGSCVVTLDGTVVYTPSTSAWSVAYWGNLTAWGTGDATTSYAVPLVLRSGLANPLGLWYSGDTANSCDGLAFAQGDPAAGGVTGRWVVSAASLLGWHHVVLTYNGAGAATLSNYTLYVDGVARPLATTPCGGGGAQTSRLFLDSDGGAPDQWVGELDEVIVYPTALNQAQVTALVAMSNPPTCTITTPASSPFAVSASPYTALAGSATDDTAVQTVSWLNTATQSGGNADCTNCGTVNATWTVASIPLVPGTPGLNPIMVTVTDGEGQQGTCQVRLDYTPPPAVGMLGPPGGLTLLP